MDKVILAPDSFKGTMTSAEVCAIMRRSIRAHFPQAEIVSLPVADGGEGSVDAFLRAAGGRRVTLRVKGPDWEEVDASYGLLDGGKTAVVEMAACAGLPLAKGHNRVETATTYGVGQLMAHAAASGCKKLIVCLGGSATNDFGAGAAAALGVRFLDKSGKPFIPTGGTLSAISRIDTSGIMPQLREMELLAMCDIDNPLYGENGAAAVFGPQKGADAQMVSFLDAQLRAASETCARELQTDVSALPGAGAAGGMGGGLAAFFGFRLQPGIETVLDAVHFDDHLRGAQLVFSGEGRLDAQSLGGKVVVGVARRCKKHGVPLLAVVGDIVDPLDAIYEQGVSAVMSINRLAQPFEEARHHSRADLAAAMDGILRLWKTASAAR